MRQHVLLLAVLFVVVGAATACVATEAPTAIPLATLAPSPTLSEAPSSTPWPTAPLPTLVEMPATTPLPTLQVFDPVKAATAALAAELNIPEADLLLVEALPVQWNDASLGCPQPGVDYPEVVTPGYLVTLAVSDQVLSVHTDLIGTAIVCYNPGDPIGAGTVPDPIAAEFIMQAKADLAAQLGADEQDIALVRSEVVEWTDSSLGCQEEGQTYVQATTVGYRIVLAVGESRYEYHTDQQRMILCANPTQ